jgi:hypothetical protein
LPDGREEAVIGAGLKPVCRAGIPPAQRSLEPPQKARVPSRLQACAALLLVLAGGSCSEHKTDPPRPSRWDLFSATQIERWREASMFQSGGVGRETDGFTIKEGSPMSGIVFPMWLEDGMPVADYAIDYEALRAGGRDFFGSATFPVRNERTFVTFVLGGWGGSQVGLSCIDGYDASENSTGSSQHLEDGRWYHVRIEVRPKEITVLLDGRPIIRANIAGRDLGLRAGEIDRCVPFGFATYGTTGRIRGCVIERL